MRNRRSLSSHRPWYIALALMLVAAVAIAAVVLWPKITGSTEEGVTPGVPTTATSVATAPTVPDPTVSLATPGILPLRGSAKAPTATGVAKALEKPLKDEALTQFSGVVMDPETGTTLWKKDAGVPQIPASTMKLLTGAAVLTSMDPNSRLTTTVVQGDQPGDIVFVGGGDVTLSAIPAGKSNVLFPGAPTVADLAAQVKASGVQAKRIVLDTSYWAGPELAQGWKEQDIRGTADVAQGSITYMQALMVDGDRTDPANEDSRRTGEPATTAGKALATALGNPALPLITGTAPPDAKVLAHVDSQPVSTLLAQALQNSDNVLAEALARQVAIARGTSPSFTGVSAAILQALEDMGIDTAGVHILDGSGISDQDRIPPFVLGEVMSQAVSGDDPALRVLLSGLPVAGVSGTLAPPRFSQPSNKVGAGWVRAKTGSIDVTYALVGYVPDVDGRILVFAFNSNGVDNNKDHGTRPALDTLAATLRGCGCT